MGWSLFRNQKVKSELEHGAKKRTRKCVDHRASSANFLCLIVKNYDIAEKTIHYFQVNHVNEEPKLKKAEAEKSLRKAKFNFTIDLKLPRHKTSVDPKLLQLKLYVRKKQNERVSEEFISVFNKITD